MDRTDSSNMGVLKKVQTPIRDRQHGWASEERTLGADVEYLLLSEEGGGEVHSTSQAEVQEFDRNQDVWSL